jgi:hypothetical protein
MQEQHRLANSNLGVERRNRLTAAGQVLRPNDSRRRNLPFVILRGDRPLHLQQRPLNSDGPDEGPNDSSPPRRSALRDPQLPMAETAWASVMQRKAAGHPRAVSDNQSHKIGCRSPVGRVGRQPTRCRLSTRETGGTEADACAR